MKTIKLTEQSAPIHADSVFEEEQLQVSYNNKDLDDEQDASAEMYLEAISTHRTVPCDVMSRFNNTRHG